MTPQHVVSTAGSGTHWNYPPDFGEQGGIKLLWSVGWALPDIGGQVGIKLALVGNAGIKSHLWWFVPEQKLTSCVPLGVAKNPTKMKRKKKIEYP